MARYRELLYAVRFRVILRYFGEFCVALAALTLVPALISFAYGELHMALRLLAVSAMLVGSGFLLTRFRVSPHVQINEALTVVGLTFVIAPLIMSYPLMQTGLGFLDALFEAVSGITTTGLSTAATVEERPESFLFLRAWMQWYGGLGFAVLSGVVLLPPGSVAKRLVAVELRDESLVGGTRAHARRVVLVYGALTALGIPLLFALGSNPFDAVVHTLAAVSTGGFSSHDASLAALPGPARAGVMALFVAGAISLGLYWQAARRGPGELTADVQFRALLILGLISTLLLLAWLPRTAGMSWLERVGHAALTGFSAQTTTGFTSLPPAEVAPAPKLLLILSMFVGGAAGSTAGGIKLVRLLVFLRVLQLTLVRTALPSSAVAPARLAGSRLEPDEVQGALILILLYVGVIALSWLAFAAAGYPPLDSLFEVVSATGTVGLSTGLTGPGLEPGLKVLLCADMLLGRLELIAILVLLYPRTWFAHRRTTA